MLLIVMKRNKNHDRTNASKDEIGDNVSSKVIHRRFIMTYYLILFKDVYLVFNRLNGFLVTKSHK